MRTGVMYHHCSMSAVYRGNTLPASLTCFCSLARLAPMSEGRMDNGVLECRYHGWQFSAQDGSCIANPQSGRPAKACLDMYPTQVRLVMAC